MTAIPVGSDLNITSRKLVGFADGLQWWQTFTLHATGVGQQDMGLWIPWDCYLTKVRYRIYATGSGGSLTAELRLNGTAGGNTVSGTSATPGTSPSWTTLSGSGASLAVDDLLWCYVTAANTTPGAQLKVEATVVRR